MKYAVPAVVILAFGLSPVQAQDKYKEAHQALKGLIQILDDYADVLETVKNKDTAKAAAGKIDGLTDRYLKAMEKLTGLGKLSAEEDQKLKKEIEPSMSKASKRLAVAAVAASKACEAEPTFLAANKRFGEAGSKFKKK